MTSDLSIFAARLREFIAMGAEEFSPPGARSSAAERQDADAEFNGLALVLFALQFTRNVPYRKICAARGVTPDAVVHWSQIPAVPTAAFKELKLTCLPPAERTHVFHSSGTTEQRRSRHFHNAESLAVYEASLWPWFWQNLRFTNYDLRLLALTPPPAQAPHSSLVHMFETVRQRLGAHEDAFIGRVAAGGNWTLDFDSTLAQLNADFRLQTSDFRLMMLGTAFSFVHLLDFLIEQNLSVKLPPGSRVLETGGYKGRSRTMPRTELHGLITERLGVPAANIVCEYGMSELSSQAYDTPLDGTRNTQHAVTAEDEEQGRESVSRITHHASRTFRFPPWTRAQVVSPETGRAVADGETGLLRVFDLANVFSVMAIQTEDLATRRGDGFELVGRTSHAERRGCSLMTV